VPLYYQLETIFRNKIASGEWTVGSKIPNENDLAKDYGVCVVTVKQALSILVTEGIISRKRGVGTYVEKQAKGDTFHPLEGSFKQAVENLTVATRIKVFDYNIITPPQYVADKLKIDIDDNVLCFKRLYFSNSKIPFSFSVHYVQEIFGRYLNKKELKKDCPAYLIDKQSPVKVGSAKQILIGSIADDYLSELFSVNVGFPILKVERTVFSTKEEPLVYVDTYYRADKYVFRSDVNYKED
jgi:GntR family transcriptional regulator